MTKRTETTATEPKIDRRVLRSRAAVLAAGRELFHERGTDGITVEEITRRTGVAKTTIYRHWRSREELVIDILADTVVELPAIETNDPVQDIRTILLALWTSMAEPNRRRDLAGMIESTIVSPDLAALHRDFLTTRAAPLVAAVGRAVDAGVVQGDVRRQTLADLLASPIIVRVFIRGDQPDPRYVNHLVRTVLNL